MNWIYFLTRPYLWLLFMASGITAQTLTDSAKFTQEKSLDTISEPAFSEDLFDFWIGEWEVRWEEEDGKIGKGTNKIKYILDGTAIQEDFEVREGLLKGFAGKSLSVYNSDFGQWKQVWIDNDGGYLEFTGNKDCGFPIFETDVLERNGKEVKFRMVFKNIKPSGFTWDWEMSTDKGKTWELKWQIFYLRK